MAIILPFPHKVVTVAPAPKGTRLFEIQDASLKGVKPGDILLARPFRPGDKGKIAIIEVGGNLVARDFKDCGEVVLVVYAVQKDWL